MKKKVKFKGCAISDHLIIFKHSPSFDSLSALTTEKRQFLLEVKESYREINFFKIETLDMHHLCMYTYTMYTYLTEYSFG